ncbi:hypothetical protein Golax_006786 [Gossypium laxum]|uniref:Glutaredoxin domain-containing protein n=1 Tax=Gossypium laxum TaxID=34288 RepID=A0A7J9A6E1_9ROSI|nr:hypothetical protein [Gossypium laxum]
MGSLLSSNKLSQEDTQMALDKVKHIVSSTPVVVISKTYCGYCNRVKQLFAQLKASYKAIELDQETVIAKYQAGQLLNLLSDAGAITVDLNA